MKRIAVIMAGGSGERFWPLSRASRPKQLLKLTSSDKTLLEEAIERVAPLVAREDVLIATTRRLIEPIRSAPTGLPAENILGEPAKRNTAGCLAYVSAWLLARSGGEDPTLGILTADQGIGQPGLFRAAVETAFAAAEAEDTLVTIGIRPTRPETGYGYIQFDQIGQGEVHPVVQFREKPSLDQANRYLAEGNYLWNSGMFFWRLSVFMKEIARTSPPHAEAIEAMARAIGAGDEKKLDEVFAALPDISIDYALMEKASRVAVVPGDFAWDDVGSWDALDRNFPHDAAGNVTLGDPVLIDTRNSIIYNEAGPGQIAVAAIGVEDITIVVTEDAVLVAPKSRAQEVKKAVAEMKARKAKQL